MDQPTLSPPLSLILHFIPPVRFKHLLYTLSTSQSNTLTVHLAHLSLYTFSDHETLYPDAKAYSQMGLVRERDTPCCSFIFMSFSLFGFGPNYRFCLNIYRSAHIFYLGCLCRSSTGQDVSPTVQNSTGWCYTMLRPVRILPVSSDPAGYAKTKERDRKREKEKGVREQKNKMKAKRVNLKHCVFR